MGLLFLGAFGLKDMFAVLARATNPSLEPTTRRSVDKKASTFTHITFRTPKKCSQNIPVPVLNGTKTYTQDPHYLRNLRISSLRTQLVLTRAVAENPYQLEQLSSVLGLASCRFIFRAGMHRTKVFVHLGVLNPIGESQVD